MDDKSPEDVTMRSFDQVPLVFSNFVRVSHTGTAFELDFAQLVPSASVSRPSPGDLVVVSRIAIPAQFMPALLAALHENVDRYQVVFGPIQKPSPTAVSQAAATKEQN